jgi:putative glycosyl hydrolase
MSKMVSFVNLLVAGLLASVAIAIPHQAHSAFHHKRGSTKRGAAYNDASLIHLVSNSGNVPWAYNWASSPGGSIPSGVEYVAMLWGPKVFGTWAHDIETALSSGCKHILGFNEPDLPSQSNLSPADAVNYHKKYILPYQNRASLGSPGVTNGVNGMGLDWLTSFLNLCGGHCGLSFIAIHWYDDASVDKFKRHVTQAIQLANAHNIHEVWITEFAGAGDAAAQATFLSQAIPWLESQSAVTRYAYFMVRQGILVNGNSLTKLGSIYVS